MKNKGQLVLILFLGLIGFSLHGTHFSSGEIYYQWAPTATDSNRYEVTVIWYRNIGGKDINYPTYGVCLRSSCYPDVNSTLNWQSPPPGLKSPINPQYWIITDDGCGDYASPAYSVLEAAVYQGFISVPGVCADFKFTVSGICCRNGATNLSSSPNIFLAARLNNTLGPSSSPFIISGPGLSLCLKPPGHPPTQFYQKAIDIDGDSIAYSLAPSLSGSTCSNGTPIPYIAGYTFSDPISSATPLIIDQQNGSFTLTPNQQGVYAVVIRITNYRYNPISMSWINIGEAIREVLIPVTANCNPNTLGIMGSGFTLVDSTYTEQNFSSNQVDSLQSSYQVSQILRDANSSSLLPQLQGLACGESQIHLDFEGYFNSATFTPTDFRLYSPDSSIIPIVGLNFQDTLAGSPLIGAMTLQLNSGLSLNGNYLLQIRVGNDNNTFINQCGTEVAEFTSVLVPVSGCSGVGLNEWPASWWVSNRVLRGRPAQASFSVHAPSFDGYFTLTVFNQVGQKVYQDIQFPNQGQWDAQSLSPGVYIYQLESIGQGPKYLKQGRLIVLD